MWKLHPDHERIYLKKYDNGDDIKIILNELKMPTLKPDALDSTSDDVYKHTFREDIKSIYKEKCALTRSAKKLYSLVLG